MTGPLTISALLVFAVFIALTAAWTYDAQDKWPGECTTGKYQSPINLQKHTAEQRILNSFLFKNYDEKYNAEITNSGHTIQVKLKDAKITPSVKGGGLPHKYILDHMHFHWQSEHTLHGNRYPLELHIVHYASMFNSTTAALTYDQGLAVLGVLFDISAEDNPSFDPIIEKMENVQSQVGATASLDKTISIDDFLPKSTEDFFRYEGSLTTPNCNEVVIWTMFYQTSTISKNQLQHFLNVMSAEGPLPENYRKLQPLNGRVVTFRSSVNKGSNLKPSLHQMSLVDPIDKYSRLRDLTLRSSWLHQRLARSLRKRETNSVFGN